MLSWNDRLMIKILANDEQTPVFCIVAADVKELNPSLYRDTVTEALECALERHTVFITMDQ